MPGDGANALQHRGHDAVAARAVESEDVLRCHVHFLGERFPQPCLRAKQASADGCRRNVERSPDEEIAESLSPRAPETTMLRAEMRRLIESKIDDLPEAYRTVFMLREVEDMTVEETATALGIPAATVRSRLFRAKARLRESLAEELDTAVQEVFGFDGERCDRIVRAVLVRICDPAHPAD